MEPARILIVEDDPDILELVQYNLQRKGYQVIPCSNGESGLKLAKERVPDLIVLDVMLPKLSGLEVCESIRKDNLGKRPKILLVTARGSAADMARGKLAGADAQLTKPFATQELLAEAKRLLAMDETRNAA